MNPNNVYMRFLAGVVATVVAVRLAVELLRPVLPVLIVATDRVRGRPARQLVPRALVAGDGVVPVAVVVFARA